MIHHNTIQKYPGSLEELAEDIGDLRYDALADFLALLTAKMHRDAVADEGRKRYKLAKSLHECSRALQESKVAVDEAWRISEPFMLIRE